MFNMETFNPKSTIKKVENNNYRFVIKQPIITTINGVVMIVKR